MRAGVVASLRAAAAAAAGATSSTVTSRALWALGAGIVAVGGLGAGVMYMRRQRLRERDAVAALPLLHGNPLVYFDVRDGDAPIGRLIIHVRADVVPLAARNFVALARGDGSAGVSYRGCAFHGIDRDARILGGDVIGTGGSGATATNEPLEAESFELKHVGPGIVAMRSFGAEGFNSQFTIALRSLPVYDGVDEVIGHVVEGWDVLEAMQKTAPRGTGGRWGPPHDYRIAAAGVLRQVASEEAGKPYAPALGDVPLM